MKTTVFQVIIHQIFSLAREYLSAKTGGYPRISPNFQNCARCLKDLNDNKHDNLHLGRKYARIFVLGHYLFLEAHSLRSRKTVRILEKIMSADNYPYFRAKLRLLFIYFSSVFTQGWIQTSATSFHKIVRIVKKLKKKKHRKLCPNISTTTCQFLPGVQLQNLLIPTALHLLPASNGPAP